MVRNYIPRDRELILAFLSRTPNFSQEEIEVADELLAIAACNPMQTDYHLFVYEENGAVLGYHCTGKRPLTDATYDLYWIAVDPDCAGKGIGSILLEHAEQFVHDQNGRWILAETSSKDSYNNTRSFYLKRGYEVLASIPDFYAPGDSLVVYGKNLWNKSKG